MCRRPTDRRRRGLSRPRGLETYAGWCAKLSSILQGEIGRSPLTELRKVSKQSKGAAQNRDGLGFCQELSLRRLWSIHNSYWRAVVVSGRRNFPTGGNGAERQYDA